MPLGLLNMSGKRRSTSPEELIDRAVEDLKQKTTEVRVRMFALELTKEHTQSAETEASYTTACQALEKLESTLCELQSKRDLLVARAQNAEIRLAMERALMEMDQSPADLALEILQEKASDAEAEAKAVEEVRQVINEAGGAGDA